MKWNGSYKIVMYASNFQQSNRWSSVLANNCTLVAWVICINPVFAIVKLSVLSCQSKSMSSNLLQLWQDGTRYYTGILWENELHKGRLFSKINWRLQRSNFQLIFSAAYFLTNRRFLENCELESRLN